MQVFVPIRIIGYLRSCCIAAADVVASRSLPCQCNERQTQAVDLFNFYGTSVFFHLYVVQLKQPVCLCWSLES